MLESIFIHQCISTICLSFLTWKIILKLSGDIEENPGTKPSSNQNFSICHWNLNSISAHNYIKVSLLRAYVSAHKFNVICISETYLDSDTSDDDDNLKIAGYNLIRADHPSNTKWGGAFYNLIRANHPSNTKWGGVCIYYKHSLAFKLLNIHYLKERINFEITFGGKICNFISLYCSPSQTSDNFKDFVDNLELNLDKITNKSLYLLAVLGDFNVQ